MTGCSFVQSREAVPRLADARSSDFKKVMLDVLRSFALRVLRSQAKCDWMSTACKRCFWPRAGMRRKIGQEPSLGFLRNALKVWLSFAPVDRLKNKSVGLLGHAERKTPRVRG